MRITTTQHDALTNVDPAGKLLTTDRRTLNGLVHRGWAEKRTHRPKGRRRDVVEWFRTDAGTRALAAAEVVAPHVRPNWRGWTVTTVRRGVEFVAEGHTFLKQPGGCGWRVDCPHRPDGGIAFADTLAELLDEVAPHIVRASCGGPVPVDLDALAVA